MNFKLAVLWVFMLVCLGLGASAGAEVSFGLSMNSGGPDSFYLNVSNYYHVPQERVMYLHERRFSDEEIPVVLFLAGRARVGPEIIIEQRLGGRSWMDIALFYRLDPGIFYVPMSGDPGPPYGRAYGHYRKHKKSQWGQIRLDDADVVNLVNLRFVSEHYGYSPAQVVQFRGQGGHFAKVGKRGQGDEGGLQGKDKGGNGKGNGDKEDGGKAKGKGDKGDGRGKGHGKK